MAKWFTWELGRKGPTPVLYHDGLPTDGNGKERLLNVLFKRKLTDDEKDLTLTELATKYPKEGISNENQS
jgi:hypothetical protein